MTIPTFSPPPIYPMLPPQESHSKRIHAWAFWLMFVFAVGQSTIHKDNNCSMQCNNAAPIYASR